MPTTEKPSNPVIAYVAPFLLYVGMTMVEANGWLGLSYEIVCTAKGVFTALLLWIFRGYYPKFSNSGLGLSIAAGALGLVVWIVLDRLQAEIPGVPQLVDWIFQGGRVGYDPFAKEGRSLASIAFVGVRLIELAIIVPLAEEFFWRGFLSRYLIANDFQSVPQGTFNRFSFVVVTLAFASVHPEILAAIAWGAMINLLYRHTSNIWACIAMHAVTNALLGGYVLATQSWQLW